MAKIINGLYGEDVLLSISRYNNNNNLKIQLLYSNGELCEDLTINQDEVLKENQAYIKCNEMPEIIPFINTHRLGKIAKNNALMVGEGVSLLCEFSLKKLKELDPNGYNKYFK